MEEKKEEGKKYNPFIEKIKKKNEKDIPVVKKQKEKEYS